MSAEALVEEIAAAGGELFRDAKNALRVRPSNILTPELRERLRERKADLEILVPPWERLKDHVPMEIRQPCQNPRPHGSTFCVGHDCGDCDIAAIYEKLNALQVKREKAELKRQQQERSNFQAIAYYEAESEEAQG